MIILNCSILVKKRSYLDKIQAYLIVPCSIKGKEQRLAGSGCGSISSLLYGEGDYYFQ
jgi:hypothetical protein